MLTLGLSGGLSRISSTSFRWSASSAILLANRPLFLWKQVGSATQQRLLFGNNLHNFVPVRSLSSTPNKSTDSYHDESTTPKKLSSKSTARNTIKKDLYENIYTVPNLITLGRIAMTPFIGYYIMQNNYALAASLLAVAGLSDLVDGMIARRWNLQTVMGSILDPAADKFLMTVMVVSLASQGSLPWPVAVVILGRDVALSLSAFYFRFISLPPPRTLYRFWDFSIPSAQVNPTTISKYNTFLQLSLISLTTVTPLLPYDLSTALTVFQGIVVCTTIASGLSYVFSKNAIKFLR